MEGIKKAKGSKTLDKFGERVAEHPLLAKGAEAQELETRSAPLDDGKGDGVPIIMRRFEFQLPPKVRLSKKEILAHHTKRIQIFLWKDGLEEIMEPKVVLGKGGKFSIFAICKPRKGFLLHERPQSLSEAIQNGSK